MQIEQGSGVVPGHEAVRKQWVTRPTQSGEATSATSPSEVRTHSPYHFPKELRVDSVEEVGQVAVVQSNQQCLRIPVNIGSERELRRVHALIDTGADICLVRRGLVEPHKLRAAKTPLALRTANGQKLSGGAQEALILMEVFAVDIGTGKATKLT